MSLTSRLLPYSYSVEVFFERKLGLTSVHKRLPVHKLDKNNFGSVKYIVLSSFQDLLPETIFKASVNARQRE